MNGDVPRSHGESGSGGRAASVPSRAHSALPTGARVDQYVIQSVLGSGGFGITYLAEHEVLGKLFAIKEYFPRDFGVREGISVRPASESEGTYRWGLDRFLQEAKALARFRHPAIVDVANVFEANGTAYMVLAYEEGRDLRSWAGGLGRAPTQDEIDRIAGPLLDALAQMHGADLLHRDVSPDNILIRVSGEPVLIDFGSARDAIRARNRGLSMVVKHGYSPPEQYTSDPGRQGPWSDIYSLAATLYFLVVGERPMDATARFVQEGFLPARKAAKGRYRRVFLEAIDAAMALRPEARPATISAWRGMLMQPSPLLEPGAAGVDGASAAGDGDANAPPAPAARSEPSARPAHGPSRQRTHSRVFSKRVRSEPRKEPSRPPPRTAGTAPWRDDDPGPAGAPPPASFNKTPLARALGYGAAGLAIGTVVGALGSMVVVSLLMGDCAADSCITAHIGTGAWVGALAGAIIGALASRLAPAVEYRSIGEGH